MSTPITITELLGGSWVWETTTGVTNVAVNAWLWRHPEYAAARREGTIDGKYGLIEGGCIHEHQLYHVDRRDDPRTVIRWTGEGFEHG